MQSYFNCLTIKLQAGIDIYTRINTSSMFPVVVVNWFKYLNNKKPLRKAAVFLM